MKTDTQIARETKLEKIREVAARVGFPEDDVYNYGRYIAKVSNRLIDDEKVAKHKLILVTAITATKAGVGKTTVSIGLGMGLNYIGKKAVIALREPSLGPCFGMKGGATGGGYAQVLPSEDINLHFTGDFHAVTSANNLIAALLDNYLYQNRAAGIGLKKVMWRRVLDVNDRSLRNIITGLGGAGNGIPAQTGFDITPASEIMAILCLARDMKDLEKRIGRIVLGIRYDDTPFTVDDLGVTGAVAALLKDAMNPNLVQTTEHNPVIIHGGPFANIAHGCNSVIATRMAMTWGDYTVTEAGFGADLGAEKFLNIKCRQTGLKPDLTVLVATTLALKMHGGVPEADIKQPNIEGLKRGFANLDRHIDNLQSFGQTVLVCFNRLFHGSFFYILVQVFSSGIQSNNQRSKIFDFQTPHSFCHSHLRPCYIFNPHYIVPIKCRTTRRCLQINVPIFFGNFICSCCHPSFSNTQPHTLFAHHLSIRIHAHA